MEKKKKKLLSTASLPAYYKAFLQRDNENVQNTVKYAILKK